MKKRLQNLFFAEQDLGQLSFEADPEYNTLMAQSLALFPSGDLPSEIFHLLETSNCIAFVHGLKLGLRLKEWAAR